MKTGAFVLSAVLGLACLPGLAAQDIRRTLSGKPDLSGNYDVSVLTPFERDPRHGVNVYMSGEEARRVEESNADAATKANLASDPDRAAPPAIEESEFGGVGGYNRFWLDRGTTTFAIDGKFRTSILTDPPNGRLPALTDVGEMRRSNLPRFSYENTGAAWWLGDRGHGPYDGPESLTLLNRCIYHEGASVPVTSRAYNNLKTIVQTDDFVVILVEWMHEARIVRLDSEHRPPEIRSLSGDSIGWWEGDTLVVDTTNFHRITAAGVADERAGHHVVERFALAGPDALLYEFTVDDPEYTTPYSGSFPWPRTASLLYEYACHEGNYAMGNTLRGARLLESEWVGERP